MTMQLNQKEYQSKISSVSQPKKIDIEQALLEAEKLIKDSIALLDYGALKYGSRFQTINDEQNNGFARWIKSIPMDKLVSSVEKWEKAEKQLFKNEDERYQRESVYVNFVFRMDILTRMAKKDNVQMVEVFDSLRQFILEKSVIFSNLTKRNQNKKPGEQEGIYSYSSNVANIMNENELTTLWKQFLEKEYSWPDALIAEGSKLLRILPKAVESFDRLHQDNKSSINSAIKNIFVPQKNI